MPVIYNSHSLRPVQTVTFHHEIQESADGRKIGTTLIATVQGEIIPTMVDGVATTVPATSRLAAILAAQSALRNIFSVDGQLFEVQGWDGSPPVKFNAKVRSVEFGEGSWTEVCKYTVVLEGEYIAGEDFNGDFFVESASENWNFEEGEGPHTYRVSHTMSAKGKTVYESDGSLATLAWQRAKSFVTNQLKLGLNSTAAIWSPIAGSTILAQSNVAPDSSGQYNRVIQETVDELDGTYSVTETYFISNNPYWEDYSFSVRKVTDVPSMTTSVTVQGTIHGLYVDLHDIETKLINAKARWATLQSQLYTLVSSYVPAGVTLNSRPMSGSFDENKNEGTISFSYEFNDRLITSDTYEVYTVDKKISAEALFATVSVSGKIQGLLYADETDPTLKFQRALARWNVVKALIYSRATGVLSSVHPYPIENSLTQDEFDGSISYSYSFDNRVYTSVKDDYTVSRRFSREDGRIVIAVTGTITGLYTTITDGEPSNANFTERFNNAMTYWNGIKDNLLGRALAAATEYDDVNPLPYSKEESKNTWNGTVSYSYEFNNQPLPVVPNALSEIITINDDDATPVIAIIPVIGRAKGPVMQDVGTIKEKRRSLSMEVVMPTTYSTNLLAYPAAPVVDITPYAPKGSPVYLEQDQVSWSPSTGRYVRTASWIYE